MNMPGHGTMLADPLLEFFGPEHARPAGPASKRPIPMPRFQPRPALVGRSTLSASLAAHSPMPRPPMRNGQGQAPPRHAPAGLPAPSAHLANGAPPGLDEPGVVSPDSTVGRVPGRGSQPW